MSLQERLEVIRASPVPQNEESTKWKIIGPILRILGWDPHGPEVEYEYAAGSKGRGGRVDIALRGPSRIVALIEAKAPGSDLSSHIDQVLGYSFYEGADVCVLTTGLEWWLYLPRESGPPEERRFTVLKVTEDPVEQLLEDFDAFLGKENLVSGRALQRAKLVRKARLEAAQLNKEIPSIWTHMLQDPDDELIELLSKRVYEEVNLRPTRPQVVAALQGSPIPSAAVATEPPEEPSTPPQEGQQAKRRKPRPSRRPTVVELWGKRYPVGKHLDVVTTVAEALYDRHPGDFYRILEIRGRTRAYVTKSSVGMHASRRIAGSEYFLDVHGNAEALRRRAELFLQHFGHSRSDFKVLYDQDPAD